MKKTESEWLESLSKAPRDSKCRLGYAHWLEGECRTEEAELIRLSVELHRLQTKRAKMSGPGLSQKERDREYEVECRIETLCKQLDSGWIVQIDPALAIPVGLSKLGETVAIAIRTFLGQDGWIYEGRGDVFSLPRTSMSTRSVLDVQHINEQLEECLAARQGDGHLEEALSVMLKEVGAWSELYDECSSSILSESDTGTAIGLYF